MPTDLIVSSGTTLTLDDNPTEHLKNNFERMQITTLQDLVTSGYVQSEDTLKYLLDSAKTVTTHALSLRNEPLSRITGTPRIDLRRFGNFVLSTQEAAFHEKNVFWSIFREISPHSSSKVDLKTNLKDVGSAKLEMINIYAFQNVTVESNAILEFKKEVQLFRCNDLIIHKTGRIVSQGGSLHINAFSIQGQQ